MGSQSWGADGIASPRAYSSWAACERFGGLSRAPSSLGQGPGVFGRLCSAGCPPEGLWGGWWCPALAPHSSRGPAGGHHCTSPLPVRSASPRCPPHGTEASPPGSPVTPRARRCSRQPPPAGFARVGTLGGRAPEALAQDLAFPKHLPVI